MILDCIVGSKGMSDELPVVETFSNFFPPISNFLMAFEDNLLLLGGPPGLVNERRKVVVPSMRLLIKYLYLICLEDRADEGSCSLSFAAIVVHLFVPILVTSSSMITSS